jgi:phospholipid transport system transporter-binding protein
MRFPAEAGIEQVSELLAALHEALAAARGQPLRVDLGELKRFDSGALAVLLEAARRAREQGSTLELVGAPPKLIKLARLYGVAELLPLDDGAAGQPQAPPPAEALA